MKRSPDLDLVLRDYFADDGFSAPDHILDVVEERIAREPRRIAWRLRGRPFVNSSTKLAAGLAAVLIVGFVGWRLQPGGGSAGGPAPTPPPTPSPSATPPPTSSPSLTARYPEWFTGDANGAGILPAGSNTTRRFMPGSTFTVPADWVNDGDYDIAYTLFPDNAVNQAAYRLSKQTGENILLTDKVANNMFAICDATGLFQGTRASEVVSGVIANPAFRFWASEPIDVTIGGLRGRQVDLQLSPEWKGTCTPNADDAPTTDYLDARNRVIVLDKPASGTIGISIGSARSSDFQAFLTEATPIVESFAFDFGTGPTPRP